MRYIPLAFLACFICLFAGCQSIGPSEVPPDTTDAIPTESEKKAEYKSISAEEAKELMVGDHILLDVRTEEEYQQEHIDGAILIPDYEIGERAKKELPSKDALILVYCRSGRRSALAVTELVNQGYTNVYDFGGIIDWPYDTVID